MKKKNFDASCVPDDGSMVSGICIDEINNKSGKKNGITSSDVRVYHGVPTLFINDQPITGLMHWSRFVTPEDTMFFREVGINLYSFLGNVWLWGKQSGKVDYPDGCAYRPVMSPEYIDETMSMLVESNPEIKVLPRLCAIAPGWWKEKYPDELMVNYSLETRTYDKGLHPSINSEIWRHDIFEAIAKTIRYFEEKWGNYIVGYHVGFGDCAENVYDWHTVLSDYSCPQQKAYQKWLRNKYENRTELLREQWNNPTVDFAFVEIPTPVQRTGKSALSSDIFDPSLEVPVIDYLKFHSETMAEVIIDSARLIKNTLREMNKKKIVGTFYGYVNLPSNSTIARANHAHWAMNKIYESQDIDFVCAPLSYSARQPGGTSQPQLIAGSISTHGKLYYAEEDTGTHVNRGSHHGWNSPNALTSCQVQTRNFLEIWRSGGTLWWMDLWGRSWFRDPELAKNFVKLREFAELTLKHRESIAEIAVFASSESLYYQKHFSLSLFELPLDELSSLGAPVDFHRLEDLPELAKLDMLKQYKLCVFLNALEVSEPVRQLIDAELKKDGRTLLWTYLPGIIRNGSMDETGAADLTGIKLHLLRKQQRSSMLIECRIGTLPIYCGTERNVYPRMTSRDDTAENLGYYMENTLDPSMGTGVAIAAKTFENWQSVWCAAPTIPAALMAEFARQAGVHIYSEEGNLVYAGPGWLAVHVKWNGQITIKLKNCYQVTDFFTGQLISTLTDELIFDACRGETRLFMLAFIDSTGSCAGEMAY